MNYTLKTQFLSQRKIPVSKSQNTECQQIVRMPLHPVLNKTAQATHNSSMHLEQFKITSYPNYSTCKITALIAFNKYCSESNPS